MAIKRFTEEEARQRKNARQREYQKRTNYAATKKSMKNTTKRYTIVVSFNTEPNIINKLDSEKENGGYATYIKNLIRKDLERQCD